MAAWDYEIEQEAMRLSKVVEKLQRELREVKEALDATPGAIRVREGGGPENLGASVALTLSKFRTP